MTGLAHHHPTPSPQEAALARSSRQRISRLLRQNGQVTLTVTDTEGEQPISLPQGALLLLLDILTAMAAGRSVTIIAENAELTTVQAADVLNVSRPFLIKLLDAKVLPYRKVGAHRRIRMEDVLDYKARIDRDRETILDQLVAEAQESDMGYAGA